MAERIGRQTPTSSVILPYSETKGQEAIEIYNSTRRTAQEWQELLVYDMLATNEDNLWVHTKFGFSVPRRNGKNECVVIREMWGLKNGEKICHTAHRTTTSHSAWERLCDLLSEAKIEYKATKQFGLETINVEGGGKINFRTRSSKGGLGEGYDLLVIDEAQEYTDDQASALKYVVSDSPNPQTLFCGTPPTAVSAGTVFMKLRNSALTGETINTGWAEWSVETMSDVHNRDLWYETNPSLGKILTERKILDEVGDDEIDFNIQRLGLWIQYNQHSAISKAEWKEMEVTKLPKLKGDIYAGIKYGRDGANVALSIAIKTIDDNVFVEGIDCRPVRDGDDWIIKFLSSVKIRKVVVDGAGKQEILDQEMRKAGLKRPILPKVAEVISANAKFEQAVFSQELRHAAQPSMEQVVSNCEKRQIGSQGGFGYKSIREGIDIALLDSMIYAYWICKETKEEKRKHTISY